MKRYLLFAGMEHYPGGGWNDVKGHYDTLEEAKEAREALWEKGGIDWVQIIDTVNAAKVLDLGLPNSV